MFEWKSEYSVGVGTIDAQHQTLFAMCRELHAAVSTGRGESTMARLLDRLVHYTTTHFAHEERLMRLHDYPDFAKHKAEHEALTKRVLAFETEFRAGKSAMAAKVLQFLAGWLDSHIKGSDLAFAPYLKPQR